MSRQLHFSKRFASSGKEFISGRKLITSASNQLAYHQKFLPLKLMLPSLRKHFIKLRWDNKYRMQHKSVCIEGGEIISELIAAGKPIERLLTDELQPHELLLHASNFSSKVNFSARQSFQKKIAIFGVVNPFFSCQANVPNVFPK